MTSSRSPSPTRTISDESACLRSELLDAAGFQHAFFTRKGGHSPPPYESLNFSVDVGDDPACVDANLQAAAFVLGVKWESVCFLSQVHGRTVVTLDDPKATLEQTRKLEGDALISRRTELACGIRTADCVPILLAAPETGWVAAVHAGWRGCVRGVVLATVQHLQDQKAGPLLAAIGPHISQQAFEVSDPVAEELAAASPDPDIVDRSYPKPHVDLGRMVRSQLLAAGLKNTDIDVVPGCTLLQPGDFYSFRRDGPVSGRHLSAIVPRPPAHPS